MQPSSAYKGAASDGTDPGVNFESLIAATCNTISGNYSTEPNTNTAQRRIASAAGRLALEQGNGGYTIKLFTLAGHQVHSSAVSKSRQHGDGAGKTGPGVYVYRIYSAKKECASGKLVLQGHTEAEAALLHLLDK